MDFGQHQAPTVDIDRSLSHLTEQHDLSKVNSKVIVDIPGDAHPLPFHRRLDVTP